MLEWCVEGVGLAWKGVGVALNSVGRCSRVLEWCWSSLEGVAFKWFLSFLGSAFFIFSVHADCVQPFKHGCFGTLF